MKVLINGAGIAGLTLAYCLWRDGHDVVVTEKSPHLREEGYMIDFFGPGFDAAERLGLLPELEVIHFPIAHLVFLDSKGLEKLSLPYVSFRKRIFDDRHFNFMRGDLERVLYKKISNASIVRFGTTVRSFQQHVDRVEVVLSDQSRCDVDLLVGGDGIHSVIRTLTFGQSSNYLRFLGYHALAFLVGNPILKDQKPDTFYTMTIPGKQVSVYPAPGNRIATLFTHRRDQPGSDFSKQAGLLELNETYRGMGWIIPQLLQQCTGPAEIYFDTVSQVVLPAWSKGRVVLIGDACYCVSLVAGQGASLALAGAYILYDELTRSGGKVAAALSGYERRLRPVVDNKQRAGRRLAKWFVPDSIFRIELRDLLLRTSTWPIVSKLVGRGVGGGTDNTL